MTRLNTSKLPITAAQFTNNNALPTFEAVGAAPRPADLDLYAYYDPAMVEKIVTIFRMYHNYMEPGSDGRTPAQRLGLAKGRIYLRDLLRF